jgi:hypothetical protein
MEYISGYAHLVFANDRVNGGRLGVASVVVDQVGRLSLTTFEPCENLE